jgi:hypothetical protein|tara:strand:- start:1951 stop:2421 length:471 start_codon:yes stop_codon:yes gene_type:complete
MTRAVNLANLADSTILSVDGVNDRVGIGSTQPSTKLDVNGAGSFSGNVSVGGTLTVSGSIPAGHLIGALPAIDGSQLTGVSGFADALSSDTGSPLNKFFKTPKTIQIGAGTSVTVESDTASGNVAFVRESVIHVGTGATFHIKVNTALATNVLGVF